MNPQTLSPFKGKHGPLLIAEIGGNHEGQFDYALQLTDLAIQSGADFVKFQLYRGDTLVSPVEAPDRNAHFKRFELSKEQHLYLAERCRAAGVGYMASVWDLEMLDWIDPYLPIYKIGSGDLTAYPILAEFARRGKPMIVSTGLATLEEVLATVDFLQKTNPCYRSPAFLALLQCTSMYPIEDSDANLRVMDTLRVATGMTVGYSDHTVGSLALLTAVAMGAEVLEFHFTDSREGKSFRDHKVSLTQQEVQELCGQLARIAAMKGDGVKRPLDCEVSTGHVTSFRRAVYSNQLCEADDELQASALVQLRPNHGLDARFAVHAAKARGGCKIDAYGAWPLHITPTLNIQASCMCPLCLQAETHIVSTVFSRPTVEVDYQIDPALYLREVRQCIDCGVYFNRHDLIAEDFYEAHYNNSAYPGRFLERYLRVINLPFDESDNKHRAARLASLFPGMDVNQRPCVLDVGTGLCVFLAEMKRYGFSTYAVDPDQASVRHAIEIVGVTGAHHGTLDSYPESDTKVDLVTFNKVLEHVRNPVGQVKLARNLLKPGGLIYIELPDGDLALKNAGVVTRAEFNVEHLMIFNRRSLERLAQLSGLTCKSIKSLVEPSGKCTIYGVFTLESSDETLA